MLGVGVGGLEGGLRGQALGQLCVAAVAAVSCSAGLRLPAWSELPSGACACSCGQKRACVCIMWCPVRYQAESWICRSVRMVRQRGKACVMLDSCGGDTPVTGMLWWTTDTVDTIDTLDRSNAAIIWDSQGRLTSALRT